MDNAKNELLVFINGKQLIAALIEEVYYGLDTKRTFKLPLDYSDKQFRLFLKELNFEYDSGYGSQYLGGTLWFSDGTWADRGEYDGSEWWEYHELPEIPDELKASTELSQRLPQTGGQDE